MASDSEKDSWQKMQEEMSAKEREEYAEDPAAWLSKLFCATRGEVRDQVKYYSEKQEEQAKSFTQAMADSHVRYLSALEARLIFWLGTVIMIPLMSVALFGITDGFGPAAIGIGLAVMGRVCWWWFLRKRTNRLDSFRKRFRELLESVDDIRWETRSEETRAKDKAFLEKYKDSILFPSGIPYERRERIWPHGDLGHIETLYLEYCYPGHLHPWPDPRDANSNTKLKCELCMTADRVQKHIEGALSAFESYLESKRQELITRIDGFNAGSATSEFRQWLPLWVRVRECSAVDQKPADDGLYALLESLRDKDCWTFDQADKVREFCRKGKEWSSRFDDPVDAVKLRDLSAHIFDKFSREMEAAASRCGLADTWDWYNSARDRLARSGGVFAEIRRIISRHEPKAMFRELEEQSVDITVRLPGITQWGYDPKLVAKERKKARRLISKERDSYDRDLNREFQAMQAFVRGERRAGE